MENNQDTIEILILSRDPCSFCDDARKLLSRYAQTFPITVTTRDIDTPEGREMALSSGMLFPPGIFINGKPFSYGRLSERKFLKALQALQAQ